MKIIFEAPVAMTATGKRNNNEDSLYPAVGKAQTTDRLFMVCDGVGGHQKGDIASQLACHSFAAFFDMYPKHLVNKEFMRRAFAYTEEQFDKFLAKNKEAKGMATTAVVLYLEGDNAIVAHCGDSRLYHIRQGQCIFRTEDHTPVNDMLRQGIITPEEAQNEKRSSQISRAIQGASIKPTMPEVNILPAIQLGDVFFMCTDGVWDSNFEAEALENILASPQPLSDSMASIVAQCEAHSKDNFTAYLLRVQSVEVTPEKQGIEGILVENNPDIDDSRTMQEVGLILDDSVKDEMEITIPIGNKKISAIKFAALVLASVFAVMILIVIVRNMGQENIKEPKNITEKKETEEAILKTKLDSLCKQFKQQEEKKHPTYKDCKCNLKDYDTLKKKEAKIFVLELTKNKEKTLYKFVKKDSLYLPTQLYQEVTLENGIYSATKVVGKTPTKIQIDIKTGDEKNLPATATKKK